MERNFANRNDNVSSGEPEPDRPIRRREPNSECHPWHLGRGMPRHNCVAWPWELSTPPATDEEEGYLGFSSFVHQMPEVAETICAVGRLQSYLVGKTFYRVSALEERPVFDKVGPSAFKTAIACKKAIYVRQRKRYSWVMRSFPPQIGG